MKRLLPLMALLLALSVACRASVYYIGNGTSGYETVIDLSTTDPTTLGYGGIYTPVTEESRATWQWPASHTFVLQKKIVIVGGDLFIEAGSVVRGQPQSSSSVSDPGLLVIGRGAKILAQGNSTAPIVFTTAATNGDYFGARASGQNPAFWDADPIRSPKDPVLAFRWGGVVILGNAPTNVDRDATGAQDLFGIESPAVKTPTSDDRPAVGLYSYASSHRFGGFDAADNSGILSYISIRHSGCWYGAADEFNAHGLTLGGVGRGTTISYVEIWGSSADGVAIFGGTVSVDHILIVAPNDAGLDLDCGYTGTVQFLAVIAMGNTYKLCEWDGSYDGETVDAFSKTSPVTVSRLPVAQFTVANATLIGNSNGAFFQGLHIRDSAAPRLVNSIVVNAIKVGTSGPVEFDNRVAGTFSTLNLLDKEVSYFKGVSFWDGGVKTTVAQWVDNGSLSNTIARAKLGEAKFRNNFNNNPGFANLPTGGFLPAELLLDPRPSSADGPVLEDEYVGVSGSYFAVSYRGAFDPNEPLLWTAGWTASEAYQLIR